MQIYLDESGDLGWKFDAPYREGGSSRYLLLAFMFIPLKVRRHPRNLIKKMYLKHGWINEKKSSDASLQQKIIFSKNAVKLFRKYPQIKIDVIVVKKTNVQPHIRQDSNKLYNYMCGLVIPNYVESYNKVEFIPDKRTIKVGSGNSLVDYLQTKIWCEHNYSTTIKNNPSESHGNYNLQFCDWIANCVWSHYEYSKSDFFNILKKHIYIRQLFFR